MSLDDMIYKDDAKTYAFEQGLVELDDIVSWIEQQETKLQDIIEIQKACHRRMSDIEDEVKKIKQQYGVSK